MLFGLDDPLYLVRRGGRRTETASPFSTTSVLGKILVEFLCFFSHSWAYELRLLHTRLRDRHIADDEEDDGQPLAC